jgi:hypothetical protein
MNPLDERMHPVGGERAWSESYYFNFVDPDSRIAMFTRMGFRPGDGWADGLHVLYLGGDRVAFTYGRREIGADLSAYNDDLRAGHLSLACVVPFRNWEVRYDGPAQDIADAAILLERRKTRPEGWFHPAHLQMQIDFNALSAPHYAAAGARGHFEQTGEVRGEIRLDGVNGRDSFHPSGFGVRDKSWGPRDWGAARTGAAASATAAGAVVSASDRNTEPKPFVNWFSMNFGPDLALGGSCFRHGDGVMRGSGWICRDGVMEDLENVVMDSEYRNDSLWHTAVRLQGRAASGRPIDVSGRILTVCPTKIPAAGGATFVNEGLTEFQAEGLTGYGISEHWHSVTAP